MSDDRYADYDAAWQHDHDRLVEEALEARELIGHCTYRCRYCGTIFDEGSSIPTDNYAIGDGCERCSPSI